MIDENVENVDWFAIAQECQQQAAAHRSMLHMAATLGKAKQKDQQLYTKYKEAHREWQQLKLQVDRAMTDMKEARNKLDEVQTQLLSKQTLNDYGRDCRRLAQVMTYLESFHQV